MGITKHGGTRAGRKHKCGGSAPQGWKPYLCLPERKLRERPVRPRAIHINEQKEETQMCAPISQSQQISLISIGMKAGAALMQCVEEMGLLRASTERGF